jgi:hypothetical protein
MFRVTYGTPVSGPDLVLRLSEPDPVLEKGEEPVNVTLACSPLAGGAPDPAGGDIDSAANRSKAGIIRR